VLKSTVDWATGPGVQAVSALADMPAESGICQTAPATGIVILLLAISATVFLEPDVRSGTVPIGLLVGGVLVLGVLVVGTVEYRLQLQSELRWSELETRHYEVETSFRIAQINATTPSAEERENLPKPPY